MNEGQPLAQTLAARMQLGLLGTANTIAHSIRVGEITLDPCDMIVDPYILCMQQPVDKAGACEDPEDKN